MAKSFVTSITQEFHIKHHLLREHLTFSVTGDISVMNSLGIKETRFVDLINFSDICSLMLFSVIEVSTPVFSSNMFECFFAIFKTVDLLP